MNSQNTYNTIAHHFSQTRAHPWKEFSYYQKYIQKQDHLLDLGCGNGRLRRSIPDSVKYTGIDLSEELLKHARTRFPDSQFIHTSMTSLPFPENTFDIICAVASFQHVPTTAERIKTLQECIRVLKPKGYFILSNWDLTHTKYKKSIFKILFQYLLSLGKVRSNDYFIPWKNPQGKTLAMRYYRNITQKELKKLTKTLPLQILEEHVFYTSKRNRNRCFILQVS